MTALTAMQREWIRNVQNYFSLYIEQVFVISTSGEPSANRKDLLALTLTGPIWH